MSVPQTYTPPRQLWQHFPLDDGFRVWRTVQFERTVLVVARTVTSLARCLDILTLLENDRRVQIVFSHDDRNPAIFNAGLRELLADIGAPVIGWEQACSTRFDLAIAASENDELHQLDAPIVLVPHGMGYQKFYPGGTVIAGMNPEKLVHRGRVVPAALALSHSDQREQLHIVCPEAVARSVVVGDPCHDRLLASVPAADSYRSALGVRGRTLVVLASTWGPESLFGTDPSLPERLLAELPVDEYQVAVTLHPGAWSHGPWQVRSWLSGARSLGLHLIPAERGWAAALLAAHCVIGDEGSASLYAAAADRPLLLGATRSASTAPRTPMAALAGQAPKLSGAQPLRAQIEHTIRTHTPGAYQPIIDDAIDAPGASASRLRTRLYDLMKLSEPASTPGYPRVPAIRAEHVSPQAFVVSGTVHHDHATLERFPTRARFAGTPLPSQHIVANVDGAELADLDAATVLYTEHLGHRTFTDWSAETLHCWPCARLAAVVHDRDCLVRLRNGDELTLRTEHPSADPLLLASIVYMRLAHDLTLTGHGEILTGAHRISFTASEAN